MCLYRRLLRHCCRPIDACQRLQRCCSAGRACGSRRLNMPRRRCGVVLREKAGVDFIFLPRCQPLHAAVAVVATGDLRRGAVARGGAPRLQGLRLVI